MTTRSDTATRPRETDEESSPEGSSTLGGTQGERPTVRTAMMPSPSLGRKALGACVAIIVVLVALTIDNVGKRPEPPAPAAPPSRGAQEKPNRQEPVQGVFSAASVWRARLADDAAIDRSSAARVSALAAEIEAKIREGTMPWPGTGASTVYVVDRDEPRVPVRLVTGPWGDSLKTVLGRGVPIPPDAVPGAGSDAHMVVHQPSTDQMWELYHARHESDGWRAEWGGAMRGVSSNRGYYSGSSWPGLHGESGWNWGATASSLPELAGLVRIDELRAGHIDHALAVDVTDACRGLFAWPAQRTDGADATLATCMPEGARLRLDPRVDVSKLRLTRVGRMLALAAQRFGMVVRDKTWGTFQIDFETPPGAASRGDDDRPPYTGPGGLWGGIPPSAVMENFPWRSLQLLDMKLCTHYPCEGAAAPRSKR